MHAQAQGLDKHPCLMGCILNLIDFFVTGIDTGQAFVRLVDADFHKIKAQLLHLCHALIPIILRVQRLLIDSQQMFS